jgi:subtilisin family serine protease
MSIVFINLKKTGATAAVLAGIAFFIFGCGKNDLDMNKLISLPPVISGMKVSDPITTIDKQSTITVSAYGGNNGTLSYTWSSDGGALTRKLDNVYDFTPLTPGIYKITVQARDASGLSAVASATVTCFGETGNYGAIRGTLSTSGTAQSAENISPTNSGNTLEAPISIGEPSLRDPARRVVFDRKNSTVVPCEGGDFVTGEIMLKLKSGGTTKRFADVRALNVKKQSPNGLALIGLNTSGLSQDAAKDLTRGTCAELNSDPQVKYADLNYIYKSLAIPNDTYYGQQWSLDLLNLPKAWDVETGSEDVIVAVIDTGIVAEHADVSGRLTGGYDFIIDYGGVACDGDGIDPDPEDVSDSRCVTGPVTSSQFSGYHGTHVAGTIGAVTNNDFGIAGVDWHAKIMPVRVLGVVGGTSYDIIQGMLYAAGLPNDSETIPPIPAKVINMSIGGSPGSGCSNSFQDAFDSVYGAGVTAFVAVGNNYSDSGLSPIALCDHAIAVGAVDRYAKRAPYSNAGSGMSIAAPGGYTAYSDTDGILSTVRLDEADTDNGYAYYQGTSMATPHAAGVAALMIAAYSSITPTQIATLMAQTATDLGDTGTDNVYGAGLINAYAAVVEAKRLGGSTNLPKTPSARFYPDKLYFHFNESSKNIIISNAGGGTLILTSVSDTENSGGDWISTSASAASDSGSIVVTVTVDRDGLTSNKAGAVKLVTNAGSASIGVEMEVDNPATDPPADCLDSKIFVLVADSDYNSVAQDVIPFSGGDYAIFGLPEASYYVMAGTDCDSDNSICEQAIDYCAYYTIGDDLAAVEVKGSEFTENIDISANSVSSERIAGARRSMRTLPVTKK